MAKRKTEINTRAMGERIDAAFAATDHAAALPDGAFAESVFEHGQWWINASTGAQWSVVDAEGAGSVDGFAFEQISDGEED